MTDDPKDTTPPASGGQAARGGPPGRGPVSPPGRPPQTKKPDRERNGKKPEGVAGTEPERHPHFVRTGVFWGLVVGTILAILVIVFASQNTQSVTVKAFAWEWSSPLFVVILISLIVGIVLDEIVGVLYRSRRRKRRREQAELRRLRGKR